MATAEELRRAREETAFGGLASGLFEYMRERDQMLQEQGRRPVLGGLLSKEPVMGTDTLRYEGVMPLIAGLLEPIVRGVDAPRAASQNLIPQEDMVGEALGTAGTAMVGGGAFAKPAGSLGANTLRVYHGTDADISQLDPNYGVTARDLYTTPVRSDAAEYGKNVLEFDVEGKIGNFLPEDRGISETRMLQTAYSDYGLDDYFDSFDDFVEAFDSGDMYQRFGSSAAQDEVVGALIDVGGFDAIRIPDAGFGDNMSESVVAQNPNVFKPVMANASKSAGLLSVASDVANRGDQILNMLKSGRGSEVTDAMLDMGDSVKNTQLNQYLAANYDLPLDEASRLQRQREMFPELGYHGTVTSNDFTSFRGDRETYIAPRSDEGLELVAQFSSADQGRVLPVVNTGNILDTLDPEGMFQQRRDMQRIYDEQGLGEFRPGDKGLPSWADTTAINAARDAGYEGIRLDERDWVNSTAVFEPQNIRSQFARFDPRLSHLSNLTAANASKGAGVAATSVAELRRQANIQRFGYDPNEVQEVDTSYRGSHQPVGPQDENPIRLDDLTKSITGETAGYPEDFYSSQGMRLYAQPPSFPGDEYGLANQQSYRAIQAARGNPDAEVTIYRGVPDSDDITTINPGDFVTLSPKYAELHAASGYGPRGDEAGKVISQKVKVKDVYFAGDDVNEFGYFPTDVAANASKPTGLLVLEQQARGRPELKNLFEANNIDISDLSKAAPGEIKGVLDMAVRRQMINPRQAESYLKGLLD